MIISSIVAGTVESWPSTTIAAESPTRIRSTPASSAIRPDGASYAVTITMRSPRRFISASSGSGSFPGRACRVRACADGWSRVISFQEQDVVDQAGRADAGGDGECRAVEVGDLDVVGLEPGRVRARRCAAGRVVGRQRARDRERLLALVRRRSALRDESASPSASRTVSTTRISTRALRSRTSCFTTATCCASLLPEPRDLRADEVEQLQADGGDAAEVAGPVLRPRARRPRQRARPTSRSPAGTSPTAAGAKTTSTPLLGGERASRSRSRG